MGNTIGLKSMAKDAEHFNSSYRQLFGIHEADEQLVNDYSCAVKESILLHGFMYISQRYVCFYSWVFGNEEKIVIPIASIDSITKEDVMLIDTALCINIKNGRSYFFASYLHRDDCYNLINSLMKPQHRSNDAEERAWTFKTSDSDASHPHIQQQALQRATTHLNFGQARPQVALNDETGGMEIIKTSFPLTSCQFYNLFLTNHAPFSLVKYHEQKDDKEIQISVWKNAKGKLDGETSARERKDIHSEKMTAHMRDFSVIIPLFVFGAPPSTRVHKVQRCLHTLGTDSERKGEEGESGSGGSTDGGDTGSHLTVETYTMTPDVPFGDSFNVIDKWTLRGDGCAPGRGPGKVEVSISVAVSFVKSSMALSFVKGKIENGTQENTKKEFTAWIETARAWMQENPSIVQQADCSIEEFAREHAHKYAPSGAQVSTTNTNTNATAAGDEAKLDNKRQSDGGDARGRSPATSSSTSSSKEYLSEQQEKLLSQLSGLGVGIPSVTSLQAASASPTVQVLTVCTLIALLLSVAPSLAPSLFSWAPYVLILVAILLFYFAPPSLMIMMRDHIERRLAQTHQQASSSSRPPKIQRTKCETLSFPTTRSAPSSSSSSSSISSPARRELSSERTEAEPHSLRRRQM